jgi:hypothetical protein
MFALSQASTYGLEGALYRTLCGVQRVPNQHYNWQRVLVGRALHPILLSALCFYNTQPAGETARNPGRMRWIIHPIGTKDNTREKVTSQVRYDRAKTQTCETADVS